MDYWYYYWLTTIKNIGPKKIKYLLDKFKSPQNIYQQDYSEYEKIGALSKKDILSIIASKNESKITHELEKIKNQQIHIKCINDHDYPELLRHLEYPPYVLYQKGSLDFSKPCIAIVGSRKCSEYGYQMANTIAKKLTRKGITVVSGLALGIDAAAHKGALEEGSTIAVLGNGSNIYYPPANRILQKQIELNGCTLSEYPLSTNPHPGFFPARNRIISGLSRGVLIVEAADKSGSLITANFALEQGRDVFAIPGNVWSKMSVGSNKLIQMGAKLVIDAEDIIEEIVQYLPKEAMTNSDKLVNHALHKLAQDERMVYDSLSQEPLYMDEISHYIKMSPGILQHIITSLELKGLIKRLPGQRLVRTE